MQSKTPRLPLAHLSISDLYFVWQETLVGLLDAAGRRPSLRMIVLCSSRDEIDAICSSVSNLQYISLASLYSDLAEADRALILEKFQKTTRRWSQKFRSLLEDKCEVEKVGENLT
ncbi:uncharacterized protein LOC111478762 [Cucurbita maxima]|uniref:Uncharacterized protein LOC111478762 n=1 Tax=Cucurbita maxima TaxID=3661 RepID=A0A6J1IRU0_CUCMA|nr:uncharacterized protein LOC111478762 [Cucurbita maxima]